MSNIEKIIQSVAKQYFRVAPEDGVKWAQEKMHALSVIRSNEKLKECTSQSLQDALLQAGSMGLTVNPIMQHCYLIPRRERERRQGETWDEYNKANVPMIAYASPSYRGLVYLANKSGNIFDVSAEIVYKGDEFQYYGPTKEPHYIMNNKSLRDENNAAGVYAVARMNNGFVKAIYMDAKQCEAAKNASKVKDSLMWTKFWTEGWKKTCIRRLFKTMNIATEQMKAAESNMNTYEGVVVNSVIDEQQATELRTLLEHKIPENDIQRWLNRLAQKYGVETFEDIPADSYDDAIATLRDAVGDK